MLARLGNVIYWVCCLISVPWVAFLLWGMWVASDRLRHIEPHIMLIGLLLPGGIWLTGATFRYILAGRAGGSIAGAVITFNGAVLLLAWSGLPMILVWIAALVLALIGFFVVMTWQVWDLHRIAPFRATNPVDAFAEGFNFSYTHASARMRGRSPPFQRRDEPNQWRNDDLDDLLSAEPWQWPSPARVSGLWDTQTREEEIERQERAEREGRVRWPVRG